MHKFNSLFFCPCLFRSYTFVNPERVVFGFPTSDAQFPGLFGDLALRVGALTRGGGGGKRILTE